MIDITHPTTACLILFSILLWSGWTFWAGWNAKRTDCVEGDASFKFFVLWGFIVMVLMFFILVNLILALGRAYYAPVP